MNKYDINLGTTVPVSPSLKKHRITNDSAYELNQKIHSAHEVLISATTVFPLTLFPDDVVLDRAKLTISHREFFWSTEVISIRIEDVLNVMADVGPFFGSLKIFTRFFQNSKPYEVNFLKRNDALRIKHILQGYIIALQNNINCSTMSTPELADMLADLGK